MRIVHEVNTPMQVGGGGRPFCNLPGQQGFGHINAELFIAESPASNHPELPAAMFGSDEAIHIEGSSEYLIPMLEEALSILRGMEETMREQYGEPRPTNCPDGCDEIEKSNGNHSITCPRHPNFGKFGKAESA